MTDTAERDAGLMAAADDAGLIERLRLAARASSRASKLWAEDKSRRNNEAAGRPLDELCYMYLEPEQTIEWRAAERIAALAAERRRAEADMRERAVADLSAHIDKNEARIAASPYEQQDRILLEERIMALDAARSRIAALPLTTETDHG